ncbi:hypothetical protein [Oleidesulfovibrio sp.]|uniref:hypothetical protein n=1 Tax=Oleidesulfovibrio sp. TaxID=2909707 RepID=UPI003A884922
MSDEARRVFKMETILGLIAGKRGADISDLLGFLSQRDLSEVEEGAVAPIAKGWLYSLHPDFMKSEFSETDVFEEWAAKEAGRLGDNVSLEAIPANQMAGISAVLDKMAADVAENAAQAAELAAAKAEVAELAPFKAQAEKLEKQVADLQGKLEAAQTDAATAKKELAGFSGKVAINETEIESSVKDIVSRAVKDALKALPVGAAAGAVAADAVAEDAPAGFDEPEEPSVPDSFGFGASGSDGDGFGF